MILFSEIVSLCRGRVIRKAVDQEIRYLMPDSRKILPSKASLFFAIQGMRSDGHNYIKNVYDKGLRYFIVERDIDYSPYPEAHFIRVDSSIEALHVIVAHHRSKFSFPVIGITGSNGKTIVKEWLYQFLSPDYKTVKSPGSYNSQIGVPLSVWLMNQQHEMGIFEAGISQVGEMHKLQQIVLPTIGLLTNIGVAHDEGFASREEKIEEKIKFFDEAETIIYNSDNALIEKIISRNHKRGWKRLSWGQKEGSSILLQWHDVSQVHFSGYFGDFELILPFIDPALKENILHCIVVLLQLGYTPEKIQKKIDHIRSVPMRLELKHGINHCQLIDDTYNNDLEGLQIGLDFLTGMSKGKKALIISDILQSGLTDDVLAQRIAALITQKNITKFIGIGPGLCANWEIFSSLPMEVQCYETTAAFVQKEDGSRFHDETILIKGARIFEFERIVRCLQKKVHGTVMEIDLGAVVHNLNFFRSLLKPNVKLMVVVKAFAYGSGGAEMARLLQYHQIDYLGVAYVDEGVELRRNGIHTPIVVLNPTEESFDSLLPYNLEPEIYSLFLLRALAAYAHGKTCKIHLKIDTGMHRLGMLQEDLSEVASILKANPNLIVISIFSHMVGADDAVHDSFSKEQALRLKRAADFLDTHLTTKPLRHILNSGGILRFPEFQWDMVRLGIGLYGIDPTHTMQDNLKQGITLKTIVLQITKLPKNETIGYGRKGRTYQPGRIATIAIGYADGYHRSNSEGKGEVLIHGKRVPVIGQVCMDMTMVDVTEVDDVKEGDEVLVFGAALPLEESAKKINTIPYEILTSIGRRVKRIFYAESI